MSSPKQRSTLSTLPLRERARMANTAPNWATVNSTEDHAGALHLLELREDLRNGGIWQERLAAIGVTDDAFLAAVSSTRDTLSNPASDAVALVEAFQADADRVNMEYAAGLPPVPPIVEAYALKQLKLGYDSIGCRSWSFVEFEQVDADIRRGLLSYLQALLAPSLVAELAIAKRLGTLDGATAEERYFDFTKRIASVPDWGTQFLGEYPVLARRILLEVEHCVQRTSEMLTRMKADHQELSTLTAEFPGVSAIRGDSARVVGVDGPAGDLHRNGRAVHILRLDSGRRVVYKPRSLGIDRAYYSFVRWLNAHGMDPELPVVSHCARDGYGWYPFIESLDCEDDSAVARFYRRQGAHLAILYVLGAYDLHHENVVASGEYPVLIDIECVVSPTFPALPAHFASPAADFATESVQRVGFLPSWTWGKGMRAGVNMSALSRVGGQRHSREFRDWANRGRDDLRQVLRPATVVSDDAHLPLLRGERVPAERYLRSLEEGFADAYLLLLRHKSSLLRHDGPIDAFSNIDTRIVLRNTWDYAQIHEELLHPKYQQSALQTDALIEGLWRSWSDRFTPSVIQSEIDQLWNGDIPCFASRASSRDLFDGEGSLLQAEYFEESAVDGIRRRISTLSKHDLVLQKEMIWGSFALLGLQNLALRSGLLSVARSDSNHDPLNELILNEAIALGDRILNRAIKDDGRIGWVGLSVMADGSLHQGWLDGSLYNGYIGVAVFLLYLSQISGERRFSDATRHVIDGVVIPALDVIASSRSRLKDWISYTPSAFEFPISSLYLFAHVDAAWGTTYRSQLSEPVQAWVERGLSARPRFDVLGGAAGIVALLSQFANDTDWGLKAARAYADVIIRNAIETDQGLSWSHELYSQRVGGMSHGTAGIGWALSRVATLTGSSQYAEAAKAAYRYDQSLYSEELGRWRDLREGTGKSAGWCNGAGGIALSRFFAHESFRDSGYIRELELAVKVMAEEHAGSDCLCHGTLGDVDVLLTVGSALGRTDWLSTAEHQFRRDWDASRRRGFWRCGSQSESAPLFGLFMGIAGIGHGLLRYLHPKSVPSVLSLDPPPTAARTG